MGPPQLPVELIEMILDNIVPSNDDLALRASDITARTLHSCLTLNKSTFNRSIQLLYSKCLYIDNPRRLHRLLRSYQNESFALQLKTAASTSMFLAPFSGDTIEEPQVLEDLQSLFDILGNQIRRMIIDMPLRSAYPDRRAGRAIRIPLRNAFRKLMALEEFTSIRDELYVSTIIPKDHEVEVPVWSRWPNLQKLALYNVDISEDLMKNTGRLRALKWLILTRPDGMEDLGALQEALPCTTTLVIVNTWEDHQPAHRRWIRKAEDAGGKQRVTHSALQWSYTRNVAHVKAVCVSEIILSGRHDAKHIYECQDWAREEALKGSLWQ